MTQDDTYNMLATRGDGLYKEKGSKFIAEAFTVMSEDEAKTAITHPHTASACRWAA